MKITISYFLVWSYSIFALLFIQRLEALTIQSIEPANFQRLESRAVRRLRARSLQPRAIPHGLYHSCIGGGLSRVCEATIRKGFSTGKLNVIKPEVQSFNDGEHLCKVTVWTDTREVKLFSADELLEAMLQIDDYCAAIELPVATPCEDSSEYEGVFVGKISGQNVVLRLEGMPL
ncbi:hypothetical protein PCANC_03418 [Puccinia coronata f. sp. avenae]|uniref:Uncharacterized protein n=1 Tax=Puccinia coronata f. sp. avenae TaxID=200324 RepID=A0A2N5VHW9_9BASI|nr:hypothetical protein PCASD_14037 [Puccinia coronata f. sp. avenae]PLW49582.1 hypothetical protein PCASD_02234 [Puccinia coronata f. sp. avenae]PLW56409.1 hypothetical protein PCANC_03418 [Puccinia coronata f. sp. avenae]